MFATTPFRTGQDRTLQHQKDLPRLPIPTLSLTFARYTKSLRPLLLQTALVEGKPADFVEKEIKKREDWADDFMKPGGLGRTLQERLKGTSLLGRGGRRGLESGIADGRLGAQMWTGRRRAIG